MASTETSWPTDAKGNPLSKVTSGVEETIPTAKYANVKISKYVTKWAEDGKEEDALDAAYTAADNVLQKKRDEILDDLDKGN